MQCQNEPAVVVPEFSHRASADFRVVARYNDRSKALVSMALTRTQAVCLAKRCVAVVVRDRREVQTFSARNRERFRRGNRTGLRKRQENRICAVYVEQWVGGTIEGHWRRLDTEDGGFVHFFGPQKGKDRDPSPLTSGDEAECVLLAEKTRGGGWMARLRKRPLAGSITNTAEVAQSTSVSEVVKLRIGAISGKCDRLRFHWPTTSNG